MRLPEKKTEKEGTTAERWAQYGDGRVSDYSARIPEFRDAVVFRGSTARSYVAPDPDFAGCVQEAQSVDATMAKN
jgi:hypothetical protein